MSGTALSPPRPGEPRRPPGHGPNPIRPARAGTAAGDRTAALDEFAMNGFHDASLNRVIEAAGIAKDSMY